ncbi:MAG: queuosine precursor transporter [bacterium]
MNELLFITQALIVSAGTIGALLLGKEALVAFICLQTILANLFVTKQIALFGLNATCGDVFIVSSFFGLNILQELFGQAIVKKTIAINLFLVFFYLIMSQFHLFYVPNSFDSMHGHFTSILSFMPRIVIASVFTFFLTQVLEIYVFAGLKKLFADKHLTLRNTITLAISTLFDTIIFSFAGLYGLIGSIWQIILVSLCIKAIAIMCCTPFTILAQKITRKTHKSH